MARKLKIYAYRDASTIHIQTGDGSYLIPYLSKLSCAWRRTEVSLLPLLLSLQPVNTADALAESLATTVGPGGPVIRLGTKHVPQRFLSQYALYMELSMYKCI